jgi:hypothetical protein
MRAGQRLHDKFLKSGRLDPADWDGRLRSGVVAPRDGVRKGLSNTAILWKLLVRVVAREPGDDAEY